jgi:hypothetical protein
VKALVDSVTGTVVGTYEAPLNFSVSGKYVIDVPDDFNVAASGPSPATLMADKVLGFQSLHPSYTQAVSDELMDLTMVDLALSTRILAGPGKRTAVLPGGVLMTAPFNITVPSLTSLCVHWSGFFVYRDNATPPVGVPASLKLPPARIMHDYDGFTFTPANPADFGVELRDAAGSGLLVGVPGPDEEFAYAAATPLTARLRFVNSSGAPFHLSDWILLA